VKIQSPSKSPWESFAIQDYLPLLQELFYKVPVNTGFNIEIKYPNDQDAIGLSPFERNMYVDTILACVFSNVGKRKIIFSSFDPDLCLMLQLKQTCYPVFFLTCGGTRAFSDIRFNSLEQAVQVAKNNGLTGIVTNSKPVDKFPEIISLIKRAGLLLCTYGGDNNVPKYVDLQEKMGVDAIICDHVAYVYKHQ